MTTVRSYKPIERHVSDKNFKFLDEYSTAFGRFEKKCPTCRGTGAYLFDGEECACDIDEHGRDSQLLLFKLYCLADVPAQFINLDWSTYPHEDVAAAADEYIDNFEDMRFHGMGLEIHGRDLATGKSWMATYILRELLKLGFTGWYVEFNDIKGMWELYEDWERKYRTERMMKSEILIIDEIIRPTTDRSQSYFEERLEWVIRHRTSNNLPTITTTNLMPDELAGYFPRVHSLISAKQYRVELRGTDFRQNEAFVINEVRAKKGERPPLT